MVVSQVETISFRVVDETILPFSTKIAEFAEILCTVAVIVPPEVDILSLSPILHAFSQLLMELPDCPSSENGNISPGYSASDHCFFRKLVAEKTDKSSPLNMYSFPSVVGENSERSVLMIFESCVSDNSSEKTQGVKIDNASTEVNKTEISDLVLILLADILFTHCINVICWAERHILTSMEHCSYILYNNKFKKLFSCILIIILLPNNSSASSLCTDDQIDFKILNIIDHQPDSFTQGLEIKGARLFETTGLYGNSSLRELNITSGEILRQKNFDSNVFSEGISIFNNSIIMLTWMGQHAKIFDIDTFELIGNYNYTGEGWGLCNNGDFFIMSNGSSILSFRNVNDFTVSSTITVTENNKEIININELECVGDLIYANIWNENRIISINSTNGIVQDSINLESLSYNQKDPNSVLNGIAYSEQDNYFLLTGKNWENMYSINFLPSNESFSPCNNSNLISNNNQIEDYFTFNLLFSLISLIAITIFVMPGSWPAFTFLFYRSFMRQHEQPPISGDAVEGGED